MFAEIGEVQSTDLSHYEYYSIQQMAECGLALANRIRAPLSARSSFNVQKRLAANQQKIGSVYRSVLAVSRTGELITPAAEWLLDNFYLIEENIRQVKRGLPPRFFRQLPTMASQNANEMPQAMAFSRLYIAHSHCDVSTSRLTAMVDGYQSRQPFKIGELWAIPTILRFELIEELRRLAARLELSRNMRDRANTVADQLTVAEKPAFTEQILAENQALLNDDTFASQLLYRLRDASVKAEEILIWLEVGLETRKSNAEEVLITEQNRLSAENFKIGNIVRGLRTIDDIDWTKWFTQVCVVDRHLRQHSNFDELDFPSQDQYRSAIETLARQSGCTEIYITGKALELNKAEQEKSAVDEAPLQSDVGRFFVGDRRENLEQEIACRIPWLERSRRLYKAVGLWSIAVPICGLTLLFSVTGFLVLLAFGIKAGPAFLLSLLTALPASEAATGLFNTAVTFLNKPTQFVGFKFRDGPPESDRTLVVIPCLISSRDDIDDLARNLEVHYLTNPKGAISFALASDWTDSPQQKTSHDEELLTYAGEQIDRLSERYFHDGGRRFFLLHRERLFNQAENCWMGWERKRGKLIELNLLLRGDEDTTFIPLANPLPDNIKYVMTLDADTRLTRGAVTKLVGKLAHPLNVPVVNAELGKVVSGHAILQPRITPSLTTGEEASEFQRIFSYNRGLDPYVFTISDVYQDLFDQGSFTGKGLYHVDAFSAVLNSKFAENSILSHDLLEGTIARSGLVTDVELVEDFPIRYEVEMSRQHRWARGDWQLLPYIFSRDKSINALGRWKMLDNLRRTLVPFAWLSASLLGWCILPLVAALLWQGYLVFSLFVAPSLGLIKSVFPGQIESIPRAHFYSLYNEFRATTSQVLLRIIFIAHTATVMLDAIVRSLYRMRFSKQLLLEWRTAAQAQVSAHQSVFAYLYFMRWAIVIAAASLLVALVAASKAVVLVVVFCILWAISPYFAWLVSRSAETEDRLQIQPEDRQALRKFARRTWLYFETFVVAEHNMLPPDNFQEIPLPTVARRTSPTNIGVYVLSIICARDFGWISMTQAIVRLEQTLATVASMAKYRGHLYNWYDTQTLLPLPPKYISSVDSGNLAGHLIAVSSACQQWAEAPLAYMQGGYEGITDVAEILSEELASIPDDRRSTRPLFRSLVESIAGFQQAARVIVQQLGFAPIRIANLVTLARSIDKMARELNYELNTSQSLSVVNWADILTQTCAVNVADTTFNHAEIDGLRMRLEALRDQSRGMAFGMDFKFLMQPDRRLLSIGFRPDEEALDESCYDLLASEARLTSLFAIAKGDLPTEHWFRLGRPVVPVGSLGALASWSGSMFEYLMPPLVMQEHQGGILNQTNALAVKRQIEYGNQRKVPWGISEAAFNARDREMTYQYSNFGVPSLGMKRDLGADLVVAPYATLLACQYQPLAAVENLKRLRSMGALGKYGFYDAVDFTTHRLPENVHSVIVRNYMAHHHGMSILAVANAVFQGRLREHFHRDPVIEAVELLLQEKAPREVPALTTRQTSAETISGRQEMPELTHREIIDPLNSDRAVALLSNGHYSLMLTANGTGYANWNGLSVTRWQLDLTEERWGTFFFLRDLESNDCWSATTQPKRAPGETARTVFSDSKAEFHKTVGTLRSRVDVIVASEHDAAGRRVTLYNDGARDRLIEVTSYAEPVLNTSDADAAHPVFSKMFLKTEIGEDNNVIYVIRNKQRDEPDMQIAHLLADDAGGRRATQVETDRAKFIGRGRTLSTAAAFDRGAKLSGSQGFTMDPVLSLRRSVRVPAGKKVSLVFWTIAAPSRAELDAAILNYHHSASFEHEAMYAWTRSQVQLRYVGMSVGEASVFQRLCRHLVFADSDLNWTAEREALQPQSALWPMGLSGDFPILVLSIDAEADISIVRKALRAQEYFRSRGLLADLVILNEQATSYAQDLQHRIDAMCENARLRGEIRGPREHIFALRQDLISEQSYLVLMAAARVKLHARNGKFSKQINRAESLAAESPLHATVRKLRQRPLPEIVKFVDTTNLDYWPTKNSEELRFWNGFGGFSSNGQEYVIKLAPGITTPAPWINVIANPHFGFHVTAEGSGFTWSLNSRDYQLTPWANDPVVDRPGEAFFIVDRDSHEVFTAVQSVTHFNEQYYEIRHGLGYSRFLSGCDSLQLELTQIVDSSDPVKISRIRITNSSSTRRRLRVYAFAEWVLGNNRSKTSPFISAKYDDTVQVLLASNPYSIDFPDRAAVLACDQAVSSVTASRYEFLGRGSVKQPQAIQQGRKLSNSTMTYGDPCAALSTDLEVAAGASAELKFMLGDAESVEAAGKMIERQRSADFDQQLRATGQEWRDLLDVVQIDTPDEAMNTMVNTWLPYQTITCRIRARSGYYQASGAFGFRDQLQDTLAFILQDRSLAMTQICNAASRQFVEGDVQHWWLPDTGAGVRTLISDDLIWLAYAVAQFIMVTGDDSILEQSIRFIEGPVLEPQQHAAFFQPTVSASEASLYEHCARALDLAIKRTGKRGLPLILHGDWNDGMDRVGEKGEGESIWLGWFLAHVLTEFIPFAKKQLDQTRESAWQNHVTLLTTALEESGWDGEYYRRAYYDDGTPLGSKENRECRIDSIAQSWSVLSGLGNRQRSNLAMDSVLTELIDHESGLIKLFTPPFEHTTHEPGYIKGYPPGVRENGGQYTHAAAWTVCALAQLGRGDDAYACFNLLNPINHARTRSEAEEYRVEPYVVAADIYSVGELRGRGGWTWYTGASGWLYRAAVEYILGIRKRGQRLIVTPSLPASWDGYTAKLKIDGKNYTVQVIQSEVEGLEVSINGSKIADLLTGYLLTTTAES